jgi:hypothetical protein
MMFRTNRYVADGSMAILAYVEQCEPFDPEPFAVLTACLNHPLPERWAFVDDNGIPGIADALANAGIAEHTGYKVQSGSCEYEAMAFTDKFFDCVVDRFFVDKFSIDEFSVDEFSDYVV